MRFFFGLASRYSCFFFLFSLSSFLFKLKRKNIFFFAINNNFTVHRRMLSSWFLNKKGNNPICSAGHEKPKKTSWLNGFVKLYIILVLSVFIFFSFFCLFCSFNFAREAVMQKKLYVPIRILEIIETLTFSHPWNESWNFSIFWKPYLNRGASVEFYFAILISPFARMDIIHEFLPAWK